MKQTNLILSALIVLVFGVKLPAQTPVSFRVLFGVTDTGTTRWDGTLTAKQAGQYTLEGWRLDGSDHIGSNNPFIMSTHHPHLFLVDPPAGVVANGFIITANAVSANSEFDFTTAQGDFSFRATEVPNYGDGIYKLAGRVYVDRVPAVVRLTETPEEEDYPSLTTGTNGDIWLAYVQFHHSIDYNDLRRTLPEAPKDFKQYLEPTGGDQIWARKYSGGSWGEPVALTQAGGDRYRTAVAVDGIGRAWVFWSENNGGNFDIFGRAIDGSGMRERVRVTHEAGPDIDPVATTDASGKVWVAWQGWRDGVAAIYAAYQDGDGFSEPVKVSHSNKNEWDPAIAADRTGRVALAWDSYRNGNYDVYERTWESSSWGDVVAIAATPQYEAYPSLAYYTDGRLWIAYEEGGPAWGKDFGVYSTPGLALYQGRFIKLKGLEPGGRLVDPGAPLDSTLVGIPNIYVDRVGRQIESGSLDPDPEKAQHRPQDWSPDSDHLSPTAKNSLPRLTVDSSGRIWLAFRTPHPIWFSPIGPVWTEYLVSFGGKQWTRPIFLNHTDNLLDDRPALAPAENGKLLIVSSSDNRRNFSLGAAMAGYLVSSTSQDVRLDPYNNDLWSQEIDLGPNNRSIPVVASAPETMHNAPVIDRGDAAAIEAMREYRGGPDRNLHLIRGDYHRHSEISFDGDADGSLLDQWRYALDAASLDWIGCCDHDNGNDREYSWWIAQKLTDVFHTPGKFISMFFYERSTPYPEGHRNVLFAQRGIRPLPRLRDSLTSIDHPTHAPDTQMLYAYLKEFDGIAASHTGATAMGTDWRDNDPNVEPVVEIFQGLTHNYEMPGAPRSNNEKYAIGGWRPKGYVSIALDKGYRLGFEASSDHISTHESYANVYVEQVTRDSLLKALRERHVYGSTDDILADVESGDHMMGDEFSTSDLPSLKVKLRGTSRFTNVFIIRDGKFVYSASPHTQEVDFSWRDYQPNKGKRRYYYLRGEQDNGELVWASPLWITYTGK